MGTGLASYLNKKCSEHLTHASPSKMDLSLDITCPILTFVLLQEGERRLMGNRDHEILDPNWTQN